MGEEVSRVAAVERAISILEAFDASGLRLSLADLHRKTQIAKPTLLRLMQSLLEHGLLMPVDDSTYCVGAATLRLAGLHAAVGRVDNDVIAILNELAPTTGETPRPTAFGRANSEFTSTGSILVTGCATIFSRETWLRLVWARRARFCSPSARNGTAGSAQFENSSLP